MAGDELTDWTPGDPLAAAHFQQPVSVLRKMLGRPNGNVSTQRFERGGFTFVVTVGKVVTAGPNGEADFTNEQYWIKPQYIEEGDQTDPITLTDITVPDQFTEDSEPEADSNIKAVTNLSEYLHGTHNLEEGQVVWFFAATDGADDPADHLLMSEYGAPICNPDATDVVTLGPAGEDSETADTTAFNFIAGPGTTTASVVINVQTRTVYKDAGDQKLYGFGRTLTFNCVGGNLCLQQISSETRYEIDVPVDCS